MQAAHHSALQMNQSRRTITTHRPGSERMPPSRRPLSRLASSRARIFGITTSVSSRWIGWFVLLLLAFIRHWVQSPGGANLCRNQTHDSRRIGGWLWKCSESWVRRSCGYRLASRFTVPVHRGNTQLKTTLQSRGGCSRPQNCGAAVLKRRPTSVLPPCFSPR